MAVHSQDLPGPERAPTVPLALKLGVVAAVVSIVPVGVVSSSSMSIDSPVILRPVGQQRLAARYANRALPTGRLPLVSVVDGARSTESEASTWWKPKFSAPVYAVALALGGLVIGLFKHIQKANTERLAMFSMGGVPHDPLFHISGRRASELNAAPVGTIVDSSWQPKTFTGELLQIALQSGIDHFDGLVADRIEQLSNERSQQHDDLRAVSSAYRSLYRRIDAVKLEEQRHVVEDVLHYCVLERFKILGISPMGPQHLQSRATLPQFPADFLERLVSSPEEVSLIEGHLRYVLPAVGEHITKISKFTLFEVFGTSVLYGYFLRRASQRFQLAKSCGLIPYVMSSEDTRSMLDNLFERVDSHVPHGHEAAADDRHWGHAQSFQEYVDALDSADVADSMVMSVEAGAVVQAYIRHLLGDIGEIVQQVKDTLSHCSEAPQTPEEMRLRLLRALAEGHVDALILTPDDVRRLALEAIAFGCFLKDAESTVEVSSLEPLLTTNNFAQLI